MLQLQPQIKGQSEAATVDFTGINRLVVLLPDQEADENKLSRQIYALAQDHRLDVLLVSLVNDPGNEYRALRRMTSLAAIIRDTWVDVETQVLFGHNWIKAIKPILKPGDLIICSEGQTTSHHLVQRKPLASTLVTTLHRPVHIIPNYFEAEPSLWPGWIKRLPYWIGVAVILVGFFFIETDVSHAIRDWAGQLTLLLMVLVEAGIIFGWTLVAG
jgi:hypothetical protein